MGAGRRAPHRVRAAYGRALQSIPLPVRSTAGPAAEAMTVLGETVIGGRPVQFGTMTSAPRLWVAFADQSGRVFGYLTGLVSGEPSLQITEPSHLAWTRRPEHSEQLVRHGLDVWHEAQRTCEG